MLRNAKFLVPAVLVMSAAAFGQTVTICSTPQGASTSGGPVNAHVTFVSSADSLSITIMNLQPDPTDVAQLVSSLAFTVSTGQTSGTIQNSLAKSLISVAKSGIPATLATFQPTGWALFQNFNGGFELCVLCNDLGAIGPSHLLIGSPAASGNYDAAKGSIAGNRPHNPFTAGFDWFTISVPGLSSSSAITNAVFGFGTTEGTTVQGVCTTAAMLHG
jgi:hypothetical protein